MTSRAAPPNAARLPRAGSFRDHCRCRSRRPVTRCPWPRHRRRAVGTRSSWPPRATGTRRWRDHRDDRHPRLGAICVCYRWSCRPHIVHHVCIRVRTAEGIGGPHVGMDYIWPMSIIMRGLTSTDDKEIKKCLTMLQQTHAGTGFMHESFHKDDATKFTRKWFAWSNTLFGEFLWEVYKRNLL